MRVGIYIGNSNLEPEIGGGYSYIQRLIKSIAQSTKLESKHSFVLIGNSRTNISLEDTNIVYLYFDDEIPEKEFSYFDFGIDKFISRKISRHSWYLKGIELLLKFYHYKDVERQKSKSKKYQFAKLCQENGIDLVFYPSPLICINPDIPYIANVWDYGHLTITSFPEVSINGEFESREKKYESILPRASAVFVESNAGKKDLLKFYPKVDSKKVFVFPIFSSNVVNEEVSSEEEEMFLKKHSLSSSNYFFYPAQFWPHKNHYLLLKSLKHLNEYQEYKVNLIFTGSDKGNKEFILSKVKEFNLEKQIKYLGFVSIKDMAILYKNATALVMPTYLGPTNMPLIEAMELGCPVICSDHDGHKEIGGDAFDYCDPSNSVEFAVKMQRFQRDEFYRNEKQRKLMLRKANSAFTIENNIISFYRALDKLSLQIEGWNNGLI